jgi:hypothetical protein
MDQVDIVLDGEKMLLTPSLSASMSLCEKYGGLLVIADLINVGHIHVAIDIVWHGLAGNDMDRKEVAKKVYATGLSKLAPKLVRYIILLMNGGREPELQKDTNRTVAAVIERSEDA